MRIIMSAFLLAVALIVTTPPVAAQYCQCVCSYDNYSRRHCRRVCTQPRFVPTPDYSPRDSDTPPYQYAGPDIPVGPLVALAILVILGAVIFAALSDSARTTDLIRETEDIRANTSTTHHLTE